MPRDKSETHQKILPAARAEFLEKGFEGATMRDIAAKAGLTAAGLYRHFADKEAIFSALVDPALTACERQYQLHRAVDYDFLAQGDLDGMWSQGAELEFLKLVYENYDGFKLLVCRAQGTKYEDYLHRFILLEQAETLAYMDAAKAQGVPVRDIDPKELHLLLTAYANALFEVVVHDFTREESEHYLRTLAEFFNPGWRAVLGL